MNCRPYFPRNKKNISNCCLLKFLPRMLRINNFIKQPMVWTPGPCSTKSRTESLQSEVVFGAPKHIMWVLMTISSMTWFLLVPRSYCFGITINHIWYLFYWRFMSLSIIFQPNHDGVWQGAQCSLLECCLTEISCPIHMTWYSVQSHYTDTGLTSSDSYLLNGKRHEKSSQYHF